MGRALANQLFCSASAKRRRISIGSIVKIVAAEHSMSTEDGAMGASTIEKTRGVEGSEKEAKKLRKALKRSEASNLELRDMLTKISARVEDIAKQPVPAKAAGTVPHDVVSVSKSQDGKRVDHDAATAEKGDIASPEEVHAFWKALTPEERFRYSFAATRDRPYVPVR